MEHSMDFWGRWLVAAAVVVLAFGLVLVLLAGPMQNVFESLYFAPRGAAALNADEAAYTAFMGAVMGSVMVGWAVLLLFVLHGPFRRMETAAWNMITASLIAWFVPDTAFSLWSGFWQNAILNAAMLVIFAIPLGATYGRFHRQRA
ncbi:MAG: hypothetical protein Q8K99_12410 [Actinomycetota bacterium]|nr:hypothetical protein [Actinomycetota bacterium]